MNIIDKKLITVSKPTKCHSLIVTMLPRVNYDDSLLIIDVIAASSWKVDLMELNYSIDVAYNTATCNEYGYRSDEAHKWIDGEITEAKENGCPIKFLYIVHSPGYASALLMLPETLPRYKYLIMRSHEKIGSVLPACVTAFLDN